MRFYYHFKMLYLKKTKPVVYYWPSARGWVRQDSSETQKTEKPTFTVFQALLTSITASFPHASPVGGLQHKLCLHQQILWVLLQKRARIHPLLTLRRYHCGSGQEPLPPGCPGSWHQPSPSFHSLQSVLHTGLPFLPPVTSTAWAPARWPPHGSSDWQALPASGPLHLLCLLPRVLSHQISTWRLPHLQQLTVQCFLIKKPSQTSPSSPALFFCIVLTHLISTFTYLWSVPPNSKCRLRERQASVSFPSTKNHTHCRSSKIFIKIKLGPKKASQARGAQGDMKTKCNVVSWLGSWNRKQTLGEN